MSNLSSAGPRPMSRVAAGPTPVTVASVPASHVYVRHIAARHDDGVRRLDDPDPSAPSRSAQQVWWPPVMLDPDWVRSHDFDVLHVHFGFDAWAPERLAEIADAVHERGRRLVQTVHDLRNPHHRERDLHDAQLAALLSRADDVITLTPGAAREIDRRWGRRAVVLQHPHVVDLRTMQAVRETRAARRRHQRDFRVGLHLKSIRPSMDPLTVLPVLVEAVAELPHATLQVNGHRDVLHPQGARYDEQLSRFLCRAQAREQLELHVHDYLSDQELWFYLASLDVSVLPYRFGTHSGWLEACRDLGTAVVAPTCGFYAEQGPVHSYAMDEKSFDAESLRRAVHDAYAAAPVAPVTTEERAAQRDAIAAAHRDLYLGYRGRS
jgi:glycosyltransferase involved in cell wall biosynthesis